MPLIILWPLALLGGLGVVLLAAYGNGGVPSTWTPAEQERIDEAISKCAGDLVQHGWPRSPVPGFVRADGIELSPAETMQLCLARELYPNQQWPPPPTAPENVQKAWEKLFAAADLAATQFYAEGG